MYRTIADMMNENDIFEIWIKGEFSDDRSIGWKLNIDLTIIIWQQKVKATAKRVNKLSIDVKKDVSDLKDRSFEQQQWWW